jgi:hypothetical protein
MWKKSCRAGQATDDSMTHALACWITKATNTHSEHVILIVFPRQHWLHERATMPRYTYIPCLVIRSLRFIYVTGFSECNKPSGAATCCHLMQLLDSRLRNLMY